MVVVEKKKKKKKKPEPEPVEELTDEEKAYNIPVVPEVMSKKEHQEFKLFQNYLDIFRGDSDEPYQSETADDVKVKLFDNYQKLAALPVEVFGNSMRDLYHTLKTQYNGGELKSEDFKGLTRQFDMDVSESD